MKAVTHSEKETAQIAENLAPSLKSGDIILLHGTLGMGKSVFARALIRKLTGQADLDVPSPTFTLVQLYESRSFPIHHYDLYRIEEPEEILQLGWEDSLAEGIVIVEWPERLGPYKPTARLDITLSAIDNDDNAQYVNLVSISPHSSPYVVGSGKLGVRAVQ